MCVFKRPYLCNQCMDFIEIKSKTCRNELTSISELSIASWGWISSLKPWNGSPSVYESQDCILIITNTTPPNFALKHEHTTSNCIRGRHIDSRTCNSRCDAIFTKISIYGTAKHTRLSPDAFGRFAQIRSRPLSDVVPTKGLKVVSLILESYIFILYHFSQNQDPPHVPGLILHRSFMV